MQALNLFVVLTLTSATFRGPDFDEIFDQLERIRFCSNGNCRYMRYQQSMRKRALLDGLPAYYIGQHHKKCSVPCQRESLYLSEKEVFKIMGFDRLRREGSQIEVQDLEKNRMLDIGKCHGACRHVQSFFGMKTACLHGSTSPLRVKIDGKLHSFDNFQIVQSCRCNHLNNC